MTVDKDRQTLAMIEAGLKFVFPGAGFETIPLPGRPCNRPTYDVKMMVMNPWRSAEYFFEQRIVDVDRHRHHEGVVAGYVEDFAMAMLRTMLNYQVAYRREREEKERGA